LSVVLSLVLGVSQKPPEVLIFVLAASLISFVLGIGVILSNHHCYNLLLFFAKVIILSKILIFAGIIHLNGALETNIPPDVKNTISLLYHSLLIIFFTRRGVKSHFNIESN